MVIFPIFQLKYRILCDIILCEVGMSKHKITTLEELFNFYKIELFESNLPFCLINVSIHRNSNGFFAPKAYNNSSGQASYQISFNPNCKNLSQIEFHQLLVHNMVHLYQEMDGTAPLKLGYHNKKWCTYMEDLGLKPFNENDAHLSTGDNVSQTVIKGGKFENAFLKINKQCNRSILGIADQEIGKTHPTIIEYRSSKKSITKNVKYVCGCENVITGIGGLNIKCSNCEQMFQCLNYPYKKNIIQ